VLHHEPHVALFAGPTGNEIYHHLMKDAVRVLRPAGHIVLELGWRSLSAVSGMVPRQWTVKSQPDLAGIPRVLIASAP
jgi:release factor glutamine methyltransferase